MRIITERRVSSKKRDCSCCEDMAIEKGDVFFHLTCFTKTGAEAVNLCHWCSSAYQEMEIQGHKPDSTCELFELIKFYYEQDLKRMQAEAYYDEQREHGF